MKKILSIFALLALSLSARAQLVTATLTITNTPSTGNNLTVKGSTFYWTNGTPIGSYMMLITNTPGNDATNLYTVTSATLPISGVQVQNPSSNVVTFAGINLSASISGSGWAGLVLTTNGSNPATQIVSPANIYPAAMRTNAWSQLVSDIGTYSTNAIDQNSPAASQLVGLTNNQTIGGSKTFTNVITAINASNTLGGSLNGALYGGMVIQSGLPNYKFLKLVDNLAYLFGGESILCTNDDSSQVVFYSSTISNAPLSQWSVYTNNLFNAPVAGGKYRWGIVDTNEQSLYFIAIAQTNTPFNDFGMLLEVYSAADGGTWTPSYDFDIADSGFVNGGIGFDPLGGGIAIFDGFNQSRIRIETGGVISFNGTSGTFATQLSCDGKTNVVLLNSNSLTLAGGVYFGNGGGITNLNSTNITGNIQQSQVSTTLNYSGGFWGVSTNTTNISYQLIVPGFANSSLANSNNVLSISTNAYVQVSGPTGAFCIASISGGVAGRVVTVQNTSGQTMVIANQSGFDGTAANRINTLTGADLNPVNIATLWYDGTASRWVVVTAR